MRCAICGIQIDSVDEAVEEGWQPYFYEGEIEHEFACPDCAETFLQQGECGEMEVKEEFRGKLRYLDKSGHEVRQDHSQVVAIVSENEPGKLN